MSFIRKLAPILALALMTSSSAFAGLGLCSRLLQTGAYFIDKVREIPEMRIDTPMIRLLWYRIKTSKKTTQKDRVWIALGDLRPLHKLYRPNSLDKLDERAHQIRSNLPEILQKKDLTHEDLNRYFFSVTEMSAIFGPYDQYLMAEGNGRFAALLLGIPEDQWKNIRVQLTVYESSDPKVMSSLKGIQAYYGWTQARPLSLKDFLDPTF